MVVIANRILVSGFDFFVSFFLRYCITERLLYWLFCSLVMVMDSVVIKIPILKIMVFGMCPILVSGLLCFLFFLLQVP